MQARWLLLLVAAPACGRLGYDALGAAPSLDGGQAPPDARAAAPDAGASPGLGEACQPDSCMSGLACVRSYCNCALAVELDEYQSCGLRADGSVWCWGENSTGQLGNGTIGGIQSEPAPVMGLPADIVEVDLGAYHGCARTAAGALWCWGQFDTEDPEPLAYPIDVPPVAEIASGGFHTCVRTQIGEIYCLGRNTDGQLGQGTTGGTSLDPVQVSGIAGVRTLAAGGFHTCAVFAEGAVACWGLDDYGQIGDGQAGGSEPSPTVVADIASAEQVSAGDWFSCARRSDGQVVCWGRNDQAQLGREAVSTSEPTPAQVAGAADIVHLRAGDDHACGLDGAGALLCWGSNVAGQLGAGTDASLSERAVMVADVAGAVDVALGRHHTCALARDGAISCWGRNASGELGDGTTEPSTTPVRSLFDCAP